MKHFLLSSAILAVLAVSASAKTGSTLYTGEMVSNVRRNIERYEWVRRITGKTITLADKYAAQGDDFLWELVTPQDIPRGIHVNKDLGCPKCGKDINRFGNYPWKCDVIERPWKITCPACEAVFPTNDFGKYYESGKDAGGVFRMELADRSLLFNADHPDPSDPLHTYGVDDGLGWKDSKGNVYRFVGYYGHYGSWAAVRSALESLSLAYVYTGDRKYAQKAGVLLYRTAQFYPDMDWSKWAKLGFENSDGLSGMGRIYGRIWETGLAVGFISAYDAVYPAIDDKSLLGYLSKKTGAAVTAKTMRVLVERNIIHEVHDAIMRRQIEGNEGMYQRTMAVAAVVLDEPGTSDKWLDWVFAPGNMRGGDLSGGNLLGLLESVVDADGMGNEASPGYNGIWRNQFRLISEVLERYPRYKGPQLVVLPKYRKMFETPVRLICLDRFIPNIGDTGSTGAPGTGGIRVDDLVYAYQTFKDPLFARMAYYLNGNKSEGMVGGIFDPEPESVAPQVQSEVDKLGPFVPVTENLPAYGLTILRSGSGENARALSLYYGRNTGHGHRDTLNIDLFGLGLSLMPDLGYPEYAYATPRRFVWNGNTVSHNTVVVDNKKQGPSYSGEARFVEHGNGAAAAEVFADKVYPQTSLYQRTIAMVDVSEKDFYLVDVFRVHGGKEYLYSLHGAEGAVATEGLNLVEQIGGTYAGPDVAYAADLGGREKMWADASGFQYLYDVRRAPKPAATAAVTWNVVDTWKVLTQPRDVRLRVNLLSAPGEIALAHGDPPQNKPGNPRRLTYLLSRAKAGDPPFVSVIEPYSDARGVRQIQRLDTQDAVILKVTLKSGRTDYIVSAEKPVTVKLGEYEFAGRFGVVSFDGKNGAQVRLAVRE